MWYHSTQLSQSLFRSLQPFYSRVFVYSWRSSLSANREHRLQLSPHIVSIYHWVHNFQHFIQLHLPSWNIFYYFRAIRLANIGTQAHAQKKSHLSQKQGKKDYICHLVRWTLPLLKRVRNMYTHSACGWLHLTQKSVNTNHNDRSRTKSKSFFQYQSIHQK